MDPENIKTVNILEKAIYEYFKNMTAYLPRFDHYSQLSEMMMEGGEYYDSFLQLLLYWSPLETN